MKPRVITVVAPSLELLGGQGIQARALIDALEREGFDARLLPVNPRFPRGLRWLGRIPVLRTLLNQLLYGFSLLKLRHADVVHVFSASYWSFLLAPVPAMAMARCFRKRVILNYHSGEAADHLDNWGRRVHPFLRLADEIVVPSEYLRDVFAAHGYSARVVYNIVDLSAFVFRERQPLRPVFLSCRNLEALYRVQDVLEAFAVLRKQFPEATLLVAGTGSEAGRLAQWVEAHALEGVEFLGRVEPEDMPALYDRADVFLNASVIDNQPVSLLEAFAAGLIVVSTPTGGIPWMLDHGRLGALVPHRSPDEMARAVAGLLAAPETADRMARDALDAVRDYTWPEVRAHWLAIYGAGDEHIDRERQALDRSGNSDETPAAV